MLEQRRLRSPRAGQGASMYRTGGPIDPYARTEPVSEQARGHK
jgi:hypothetical protein